jgi:hypothetical protein
MAERNNIMTQNTKFFSLLTAAGVEITDLTGYIKVAQEYAFDEEKGISNFHGVNGALSQMLEADKVSRIIFHAGDNVQKVKGTKNCKSGLSAATSHLFYNTYGSDLTTTGLHIRKAVSASSAEAWNAGYVSNRYGGTLVEAPAKGWEMVSREYFEWITEDIKEDAYENTARKHKYIDYMLMGTSLDVWVAPIRDYAATFIMQWFATSEDNGFQIKDERKDAYFGRQELRKIQVENYYASIDEEKELPAPQPTNEGEVKLLIQFVGKVNRVDIMKLQPQAFMLYQMRRGRKVGHGHIKWDPADPKVVADFVEIAEDTRYAVDYL